MNKIKKWYLYIVKCADDSYYTGITINVENRINTHNSGKGAKYTKYRLPVELMYMEKLPDRVTAMKREIAVKRLSRIKKEKLISEYK